MTSTHNRASAENRSSPRVSISHSTVVNDAHTGKMIGQLVNLSSEGLMIVSSECIPPGTVRQIVIQIELDGGTRDLNIGIESLWSADANESGAHWTGMQIIDISPDQQALLNELL